MVSTARDTGIPVKVELHTSRPTPDLADADHAAEVSLRASLGKLIIAGVSDHAKTATRVAVPAGDLRALILFHGLGRLTEDALDGDDRYAVHLWPEKASGGVAHRQWEGDI